MRILKSTYFSVGANKGAMVLIKVFSWVQRSFIAFFCATVDFMVLYTKNIHILLCIAYISSKYSFKFLDLLVVEVKIRIHLSVVHIVVGKLKTFKYTIWVTHKLCRLRTQSSKF